MKYTKTLMAAVVLASAVATQAAITLDFASVQNSDIHFFGGTGSGGQFNLTTPGPGPNQFQITSQSGAAGTLGLFGYFSGGPWSYGSIVTVLPGFIYTATVTTVGGQLHIRDASNVEATGTINWINISSTGGTGGLNYNANVNISGMSYSGTNPGLQALVAPGSGSVDLTFQWDSVLTLPDLAAVGADNSTSYSGTIAVVPEPTTMVAGALLLLPFAGAAVRTLRKK